MRFAVRTLAEPIGTSASAWPLGGRRKSTDSAKVEESSGCRDPLRTLPSAASLGNAPLLPPPAPAAKCRHRAAGEVSERGSSAGAALESNRTGLYGYWEPRGHPLDLTVA